ncbi:hypothetical protein H0H92_004532 [Tricholoma furcatifolium]|nr:hypothetical protein H0H92_004532 [Tricholoma furcatifolium]
MPLLLTTSGGANPAHELLDAILVTSAPYTLRNAARIALKIGLVESRHRTRADLNAVQPLVDDACGFVYIMLYTDLGHLYFEGITTLCDRALKAKEIERHVEDLRARLRSLLDRFGVREFFSFFMTSDINSTWKSQFNSNIPIQQHFIESMRQHRSPESAPRDNGQPSTAHALVPASPIASPASHQHERLRSRRPAHAAVMAPGGISIVVNVDSGVTRDSGNTTTTTTLDSYNNNTPRADESRRPKNQAQSSAAVDP